MYLMKDLKPKGEAARVRAGRPAPPAHIWTGNDTACQMWSTGGIGRKKAYRISSTTEGRKICSNCLGPAMNAEMESAMDRDRSGGA